MKSIVLILSVLFLVNCAAQEKEKQQKGDTPKEASEVPEGQWQVHREYDKDGNLIRYDSIYSWSYSTDKGESVTINLDSIMDEFRGYFKEVAPFDWKRDFSYFPGPDSLLIKEFFAEDYFYNHWERQQDVIDRMIKKMDSSRNEFLRKYHSELMDSAKEEDKI